MSMLGKRFLAVLALATLIGGAFVGMTMASGQWNVVGTGLEPGQGYGVQVANGNDRIRLSLGNATTDPLAAFSVWSPDGTRAGYFELNGNTKSADVVTGPGPWLVFVYKAQGADLTLSVHGTDSGVPMVPAEVERREVALGSVDEQGLDRTFTAVLSKEPALAGVYLEGSARGISSELRTDTGIVEVVHDEQTDAVQGGLIVDSKGERSTFPANLKAGAFTAHVTATEIRGTLQLVALYLKAPDFPAPKSAASEDDGTDAAPPAPPEQQQAPPPDHHGKSSSSSKAAAMPKDVASCGSADAGVPYAVQVARAGLLSVRLNESSDPVVSVFDPQDDLLGTITLKKKGDTGTLPLAFPGDYVLYSRGASVDVSIVHASACKLVELKTKSVVVANVTADLLSDAASHANFTLGMPPLQFGLAPADPLTAVVDGNAKFTGPKGKAASSHIDVALGAVDGSGLADGLGGIFGTPEQPQGPQSSSASTTVDAGKLVKGPYVMEFNASAMQGTLVAFALEYVRGTGEPGSDGA